MIKNHHKFMLNFSKSLVVSFRRPVFLYLISLATTLQILFAGLFFLLEHPQNVQVKSFFDSLYYTVTVMTGVGLGDILAITTAGRALSMLMMLTGTAIYVSFTGVLVASILQIESEHMKNQ
jgi:voltage-gated potassium channel